MVGYENKLIQLLLKLLFKMIFKVFLKLRFKLLVVSLCVFYCICIQMLPCELTTLTSRKVLSFKNRLPPLKTLKIRLERCGY